MNEKPWWWLVEVSTFPNFDAISGNSHLAASQDRHDRDQSEVYTIPLFAILQSLVALVSFKTPSLAALKMAPSAIHTTETSVPTSVKTTVSQHNEVQKKKKTPLEMVCNTLRRPASYG